jgi:class 3 adenylate cyclase
MATVIGSVFEQARLAGISGPRRLQTAFFRFLDSNGKLINPPDAIRNRLGSPAPQARRKLEQRLALFHEAMTGTNVQEVGYLAVEFVTNRANAARPGSGLARTNSSRLVTPGTRRAAMDSTEESDTPILQEVLITKVISPSSGKSVGALAIGFPLADLIPQPKFANSTGGKETLEPIQSGLWVEGTLHVNPAVVPNDVATAVASVLGGRLKAKPRFKDEFDCEVHGTTYRVVAQSLNENPNFPQACQVCLYSLEEARHAQKQVRWKVLASGCVALAGALLLSLLLSHGLTVPIRELVSGTEQIQKGNFGVSVPVRSRDDIGRLAASFNQMAHGLAQKEVYRQWLDMVADEQVAEQLVTGKISLRGAEHEVTVLFCDIRGFTPLTQNMPPADVIRMLNEHMTALTQVVKLHNGVVDKFVGDLLMAIFGAPVSHGQDAFDAARCALDMLRKRAELNLSAQHRLEIGVGIATGRVVAGCMGSAARLNYTVLGERVNLASRLCSQAAGGEALMDQTTMERTTGFVVSQPAGLLNLKGFSAPVQAYKLEGLAEIQTAAVTNASN